MKKNFVCMLISIAFIFEVTTATAEGVLIKDWLVLGTFKCDTIDQALDIQFLENEPHIFPDDHDIDLQSGYSWVSYSVNESGVLNFLDLKLPYTEYCVVYTATYIYSPSERNVNFLVGSDDGISLWINGNEIHHKVVWRGVTRGDDTVPVRLAAGWNRLLVKVFNGGGGFALIAEVEDENGTPPSDLIFTTHKPDSFKPVGSEPFPYISSVKLGISRVDSKTNSRLFPLEIVLCNLGTVTNTQGRLMIFSGDKQIKKQNFRLQKVDTLFVFLNSNNILDALQQKIIVQSYSEHRLYDKKTLHLTSTDVFASIFGSDQLPMDALVLKALYSDLSENLFWYQFFSGEELPLKDETMLTCVKAALNNDWDTFLQTLKINFKDLSDFSQELKKDTLHLIGQSHIDMAWKWRWQETVDVCRRTYQSAINFFDKEPDFKYIQSQAVSFSWMEENDPELFGEIQQKVKEGRFFLVGGMWVEPDFNVPSGESLVRQFLYGKRYFREKFNVDCVVGYTPDTFGYTWTLPQILRKAGMKYFVTTKIRWNDTTEFPFNIFWWRSADGSRVLTCFPMALNVGLDLRDGAQDLISYKQQGLSDVPELYGVGDHGGGPTRQHFAKAKKMQRLVVYPTAYYNDLRSYMERVERKYTDLPEWNDELYLEYHRGTITTHGLVKRRNRKSEIGLEEAEKLAVFSQIDYPKDQLDTAWKKTLFNQFHDILPGSSIPAVYIDANKDYDDVQRITSDIVHMGMAAISNKIKTKGKGLPVIVFNPLSWQRNGVVTIKVPKNLTVAEILDKDQNHSVFQQNGNQVIFIANNVPQSGYKTFWIREGRAKPLDNELRITNTSIENRYYRIEIDVGNGNIRRLYDKIQDKEVFAHGQEGNVLQFFEDLPSQYDAWNIGYTGKKWLAEKVERIEIAETGPARAILRYVRVFQNSKFVQDYILYHDIPRVDIRTHADWHEHHVLLKAAFPVSVNPDEATYEIAYGTIRRTTHPQTAAEKAKWEVSAHKFVDLSESSYGVSLLNDCKYGHDIVENMIRITLLRSPLTPDPIERPQGYVNPFADMGEHEFIYSIYPHVGDYQQAFTYHQAYELNYPLIAELDTLHRGVLPPQHSFITLEPSNLILSVVKRAEDSKHVIVRVYEIYGQPSTALLSCDWPIQEAYEMDLMEERIGQLKVEDHSVKFTVQPYEIFTLEIE